MWPMQSDSYAGTVREECSTWCACMKSSIVFTPKGQQDGHCRGGGSWGGVTEDAPRPWERRDVEDEAVCLEGPQEMERWLGEWPR